MSADRCDDMCVEAVAFLEHTYAGEAQFEILDPTLKHIWLGLFMLLLSATA